MVEFPKQDLSLFLNKKLNSKGKEALWQLVPGSSDNGYSFPTEKAMIGLGSVSEQAPVPETSWLSLTAELPLYHHTHLPKAEYILKGRRALDREPWTIPGPAEHHPRDAGKPPAPPRAFQCWWDLWKLWHHCSAGMEPSKSENPFSWPWSPMSQPKGEVWEESAAPPWQSSRDEPRETGRS